MGDIVSITNAYGEEETFSYDLLGRVKLRKDMEGYETAYSYTEAGDIKSILYNDGRSVEYTYNSLRQLIQVKDALGTINIETDKFGRATKVVDYTGDEVSYRYGKYGERLKAVYPDGKSVSYEYDKYLRLTSLTSGNKRVDYTYDKEGRLIRKDMPDEVSSIYKYNERGFLSSLSHLKGNRKLEEYTYDYDLLGNKTKIVKYRDVSVKGIVEDDNKEEIIHRLWQDSGTFNYSYDSLNRLVEVKRGDRLIHKYAYDAFGNRTLLKNEDKDIRYTYDALDRLIKEGGLQGSKIYEYDKRGNLTGITDRGRKIRAYEYDATGRLGLSYSFLGKARNYSYDGLGNRVGIKEYEFERGGFGENKLKDISELDLLQKEPIYEEKYTLDRTRAYHNLLQNKTIKRGTQAVQNYAWDFNAVFMEGEGKEFTYLQDELGSVIRLLEVGNEGQTVYGYNEFGEDTYNTQGKIQPFGYTGYRYDNVADTYFAQAREYVVGVGRFAGEDWIKGKIYYPQTINIYTYCLANPLKFYDPTGLDSYVFYDETNFAKQAADEAGRISNYWGTKVNLISVDSNQDFKDRWNKIEDSNIEDISLLFHGQPQVLIINEDENLFLTVSDDGISPRGNEGIAIRDLKKLEMKRLNIMSCNTGHLDYKDNVATKFLSTQNVTEVYSWDGSIVYNKMFGIRNIGFGRYVPGLADSQRYFESWIKSDEKRKPFGRIVYTWNKDKTNIVVSTTYVGDRIQLKYPMCDGID